MSGGRNRKKLLVKVEKSKIKVRQIINCVIDLEGDNGHMYMDAYT